MFIYEGQLHNSEVLLLDMSELSVSFLRRTFHSRAHHAA
jgi:hypothetical protein